MTNMVIMETTEALIPQPSDVPTFVTTIFVANRDGIVVPDEIKSNWFRRVATREEILGALGDYWLIKAIVRKVWEEITYNSLHQAFNDVQLMPDDKQRIDIYVKPIQETESENF